VAFQTKLYDAGMSDPVRVTMPDWIRTLAASHPFGPDDRRGTANLIDAAARARAAACIRTGNSVSLARPLAGGDYNTTATRPGFLDNCDFAALRRAHGPGTQVAGALVVSLLAVEGANGVNLNPLVLT
jgi:hypothetical protein